MSRDYLKITSVSGLEKGMILKNIIIKQVLQTVIFMIVLFSISIDVSYAERIKDVASIEGIRTNQLVGYGLVVGLDGTGDGASFTAQSLKSMLAAYGIKLPANSTPKSKNVAAVMVHAELPAFAKVGQRIDITVATLGSAKSLRGGSLLLTPL